MNISVGLMKKFKSLKEALEENKPEKIKLEMTAKEYLAMIKQAVENDRIRLKEVFHKQLESDLAQKDEEIAKLKGNLNVANEEIDKLNRRCNGLAEAVGKWKRRSQGAKGFDAENKGIDVMANVGRISFSLDKQGRMNRFGQIHIETEIPINLELSKVIEYFSKVDARDLYQYYPKGAKFKVVEIYANKDCDCWNAILQGSDWRAAADLTNKSLIK